MFSRPPKVIRQSTVSRDVLTDPDIELYVGLSIADTYLLHTDMLDDNVRNNFALRIGTAKRDLRLAGPGKKYFHDGYRSEFEENLRAGRIGSVNEVLEDFPFNLLQEGGFPTT
jgi:hypothetical protein